MGKTLKGITKSTGSTVATVAVSKLLSQSRSVGKEGGKKFGVIEEASTGAETFADQKQMSIETPEGMIKLRKQSGPDHQLRPASRRREDSAPASLESFPTLPAGKETAVD